MAPLLMVALALAAPRLAASQPRPMPLPLPPPLAGADIASPTDAEAGSPARAEASPAAIAPAVSPAQPTGSPRQQRRRLISLGAVAGTYAAITTWMYFAWFYDKPELPSFTVGGDHWFGERTYAGGADKVGHMWSSYALARLTTNLLQGGGWSPRTSRLLGSGLSCALFTYVEIHDGFFYQMSPGDLVGDAAGCVLSWAMERSPALDRMFDLRVEYVASPEYRKTFAAGDIDIAEDYSGQTFLLAAHLGELPWLRARPAAKVLRYVDAVIGFRSRNYKPDPDPALGKHRQQTLFFGVSLNAQALWDDGFARRRGVRRIGHGVFEVANLPYTSLPLLKATRSPDD